MEGTDDTPRERKKSELADKIDINMTPMIDIVFQLLAFFIMSLKIVQPEGDFDVRMPLGAAAAAAPDDDQIPPIRIRLMSGGDGLAGISMNGSPVGDFDELREKVIGLVGTNSGPNSLADKTEVELDCDYSLPYRYVVNAISAVSGKVQDGQVIELIKKIKFAPPKKR
jgi:biopolymer transport protein ExbD